MSKKIVNILLLIVFLLSVSINAEGEKIPVSQIKIGNRIIEKGKWEKIVIKPNEIVTFYYSNEVFSNVNDKILFRGFLNGNAIESVRNSINADSVTLKDLKEGEYIFKLQAYSVAGWESDPFLVKLIVNNKIVEETLAVPVISEPDSKSFNNLAVYIIIGICVLQLFVILYFVFKKKEEKPNIKFELGIGEQYNELKVNYRKLVSKIENMRANSLFFRRQIEQLKVTISQLEEANLELLKQRDKLLYSNQKLEQLQIKKNELFAMAVHDIKNPAGAIRGYIQLLESYDLTASEQKEIMQSLIDTSTHIIQLAQDMAIVVAKEEPETALDMEVGSIKKIIDSLCIRNTAYAKSKNVKLINNSSPSTPNVNMDANKIEEVIDNLISNAIKFAPPETIVQVKSFFSDKKVMVEVIDNGVGLSDEDIKKAFTKGSSLTPKPTGDEKSSGLGLWIVKKIIDDHSGSVWVKSKPGVGSSFGFDLPL